MKSGIASEFQLTSEKQGKEWIIEVDFYAASLL